ncbi:hypothetical protein G8764_07785 [Pseudomaricurvus alcaniphilus]|uniref:hypothetical protein n=1 Tax=Pseudomaricurvus alcaniphilus TaxID=1166482 RepID=UPI00140D2D8E|nr:hypothetical protein [Pseudomaricurvus alcaniphilus]NHN37189.1 hypothetical protein [Pseudomaricurvus alcaniphilus]
MKKFFYSIVAVLFMVSGCATIVGEPTQLLPITSTPDGAEIEIVDERGISIFKGTTPSSVSLQKSDGSYWGGKSYKVIIKKVGYSSHEVQVETNANGWYIGGNLLFGGLIGYFIVDPLNGNMYTLSTKEVNASLTEQSAKAGQDKGSMSIVLLENIPVEHRSKMVRIN